MAHWKFQNHWKKLKMAHLAKTSSQSLSLFPYLFIVTMTFDLTPKINGSILSLWLTCMSSLMKRHTMVWSLSCSLFKSLFPYMFIMTLTFDSWPPKSIEFILSSWTCLPSLMNRHTTVYFLSSSQGQSVMDTRTHWQREPQLIALQYPPRNSLGGNNKGLNIQTLNNWLWNLNCYKHFKINVDTLQNCQTHLDRMTSAE